MPENGDYEWCHTHQRYETYCSKHGWEFCCVNCGWKNHNSLRRKSVGMMYVWVCSACGAEA